MNVLICLDCSAASDLVLKESEKLLQAYPQATVYVHTVQDSSILSTDQGFGGDIREAMQTECDALKQKAEVAFGKREIKFSSSIGLPVENILEHAGELPCDLLILGTHGRTGFDHVMMGSVAEKVLRRSECNTLVIPVRRKI